MVADAGGNSRAADTEKENKVVERLLQAEFAADGIIINPRRIWMGVPAESLPDVLRFCADELGFYRLCAITGLDTGENFEFIYHIANWDGIVLNARIRTKNGDGVTIRSVLPVYAGATFYEKELEGLLGVKVDGLPEGRQYPLPDNWGDGGHPMRKDWKPPAARARAAETPASGSLVAEEPAAGPPSVGSPSVRSPGAEAPASELCAGAQEGLTRSLNG